jgi:hypothetical protein
MGLSDTVDLYDDVHLPEYPDGIPPAGNVEWQTKGIDPPQMNTFRITADGMLLKEEFHRETVPPEDRPYADRDDVDEDDVRYHCGSRSKVHDGWTERDNYHGRFQITSSFDGLESLLRYRVTFTHGRLEGFERVD